LKNNVILKKERGFALIFVIILFTVLFAVILGTIELTMSSLMQSKSIEKKTEVSYTADSAMELILFYISEAVGKAKDKTYEDFFDENGNLKETYRKEYANKDFDFDEFKKKYIDPVFYDYISDFFENKGGNKITINIKLENGSNQYASCIDDLVNILKNSYKGIEKVDITPPEVNNNYTITIKVVALDDLAKTRRIVQSKVRIFPMFENGTYSVSISQPSPQDGWDNSIFDISNYVLFSGGDIVLHNNSTVTGGNIYCKEDLMLENKNSISSIGNIIVKDGQLVFDGNNNEVKVDNLIYTDDGVVFNGNNNSLNTKILFSNAGISLKGKDNTILADKIFCNALDIEGKDNSLTVNDFVYFNSLKIDGGELFLNPQAKLYGKTIEITDKGLLKVETVNEDVNTVVYADTLNIGTSATIDAANAVIYCKNLNINIDNKTDITIKAKEIICSDKVTINSSDKNNREREIDIEVAYGIKYKYIYGIENLPDNIKDIFKYDPNISFQIQYPQIPQIIAPIQDSYLNRLVNFDNVTKKDIQQIDGYQLVISPSTVDDKDNDNNDIFKANSNDLYIISKGAVNIPEKVKQINGALIANDSLEFEGGELELKFVTMPENVINYLKEQRIINPTNTPISPEANLTIIPTRKITNIAITSRYFVNETE